MKISATLQPLLDATRLEIPSLLKQLQVGQIIQAKVLAQLQPGMVRLQIASSELLARSPVTLAAGARLQLEVVRGLPVPELRILQQPRAAPPQQAVVRSAMPRQLPPAEIRQALGALRVQAQTPQQIDGVRQLVTILQEGGVRLNDLGPAALQRAVTRSGLFHEARLAGAAPFEAADTKTRLLQLLAVLNGGTGLPQKNTHPPAVAAAQAQHTRDPANDSMLNRLIRLIEGAVSRIQLQQAAALPGDEHQRQAWQIDLPIHLPDETLEARLRIEREEAGQAEGGAAAWAVNLAFRFDTIGTLQCRIALAGERVSATFWSESDNTHQRVEQRLPNLREAFEAQGFEVVHLAGVLGEPTEPLIRVPKPETLLDERA